MDHYIQFVNLFKSNSTLLFEKYICYCGNPYTVMIYIMSATISRIGITENSKLHVHILIKTQIFKKNDDRYSKNLKRFVLKHCHRYYK